MVALHSSRHDNIGSSCARCVLYIETQFGLKFLQELELAYEYLKRHPPIGRLYANNRGYNHRDKFS